MKANPVGSSEMFECTPPQFREPPKLTTLNLLPEKSKAKYEKFYREFLAWKNKNEASIITKNIFVAFFKQLATKYAPTSVGTKYSMLRAIFWLKHNVDISHYKTLLTFLRRQSVN